MITVYDSKETDFKHNGLVIIDDIVKICTIVQELNGTYELELEVMKDDKGKYKALKGMNIIKADGQLFRIPFLNNVQSSGLSIKVKAYHIFYDLDADYIFETEIRDSLVTDILKTTISNKKFQVLSSNIASRNSIYLFRTKPTLAIYNQILSAFEGELYRDNFKIGIFKRIGKDTGISIEYAKNILGFEQTLDYSEISTRIMPVGADDITIDLVNNGSKWLDSPRIGEYPFPFCNEVKFDDIADAKELKEKAESLWGKIDAPKVNYKISFLELSRTQEYKKFEGFETLNLGDTVTIKHKIFNVDFTARVIKVKKDVLANKIEEIELGQFKDNLKDMFDFSYRISDSENKILETKKQFNTYVQQNDKKIELIADNLGKAQASFKVETEKISSSVSDLTNNTNTRFEQTSKDISARVIKDNVIQTINLSSEGLLIDVSKVNMKNAILTWGNLDYSTQNTIKNYAGKDGVNGINGRDGRDGRDSYIPDKVSFTRITKDAIESGDIIANKIYTTQDRKAFMKFEGGWIYFYYEGYLIFKIGIDGSNGKPQLYFSNGCSIDTYQGDLRLRTSDNNYLKINGNGGIEYKYNGPGGIKSIVIVDGNGNYMGGGGGGYYIFA